MSVCILPVLTDGSGAIFLQMKNSQDISGSLPSICHGMASPTRLVNWDGTEYQLTTARYTQTIRAFCAALDLDKPVVMGCSIGGRIVLNLAIDHASEFRALVGLEAADFRRPGTTPAGSIGRTFMAAKSVLRWFPGLLHRRVRRKHVWKHCGPTSKAAPGVFKGDLYFYRVDGDLRGRTKAIDTGTCPLYLLTGEYDFSCMPEDTVRTAADIPGVEVTVMEQLGHFPMSENPMQFPALHRTCTRESPAKEILGKDYIWRRYFGGASTFPAMLALFMQAAGAAETIKIGILNDQSGVFADNGGVGSVAAAKAGG